MSFTMHDGEYADNDAKAVEEPVGYSEDNDDHTPDPTGMTGTLETSGTSGTVQTAEDVSPIFDVADEQAAQNPAPEGTAQVPEIDPAATGEDALTPVYEDKADEAAAVDGSGDESAFDASKDPGDFTVKEVLAFLSGASDEDKKKVQAAEAKGQDRKGIADA